LGTVTFALSKLIASAASLFALETNGGVVDACSPGVECVAFDIDDVPDAWAWIGAVVVVDVVAIDDV
jgi:hypothetical protein